LTAFERQQRLLDIIPKERGIRIPEFARREKRPASLRTWGRCGAIVDGQRLSSSASVTLDQITYLFADSQFDPRWIQPWQKFSMALTVCSGSAVMAYQTTGRKRCTSAAAVRTSPQTVRSASKCGVDGNESFGKGATLT
jgi:hypothetical protein